MSQTQSTLTYESVLDWLQKSGQEFDRRGQEFDRRMEESNAKFVREREDFVREREEADRRFNEKFDRMVEESKRREKVLDKKISDLGSRMGEIIEHMVRGNILDKFQDLGYDVTGCSPNKYFKNKKLNLEGEIDLLLDDGDVAILISVKTTLETEDVRKHIKKIEEYRQYTNARGVGEKQRYIGAIAGAVVKGDAAAVAQENGMYVIVQSGEAVDIVTPPEGFKAKEW